LPDEQKVIAEVKCWIEKAVIGLDLCPFAKPVYEQGRIHYIVSPSEQVDGLMFDMHAQLLRLRQHPENETTLLIIPCQLADFSDFNQMLDQAEALLKAYDWVGEFQLASFHPQYQFANTQIDDRENWSNRAPYPILHVLRESSLEQAIEHYPEVAEIPARNIRKLRSLDDISFDAIFKPDL
jgi:uncharacterized protein